MDATTVAGDLAKDVFEVAVAIRRAPDCGPEAPDTTCHWRHVSWKSRHDQVDLRSCLISRLAG